MTNRGLSAMGVLDDDARWRLPTLEGILARLLDISIRELQKSWSAADLYGRPAEDAVRRAPLRAECCVDEAWFRPAHPDARFMHCLPVRRNVKVADEVQNGPRSVVVRQAGNRLHAQKALLIELLLLGAR